ncbi:MAG: signal peptide peptidase SppA [Balneolaceae bacterium]|nr:signal peptide peptidase SppA [Balneolaceae bacterium]
MKFFKSLIAATLGTFLALLIAFFVLVITFSGSGQAPEPYIRDNTVLEVHMSGSLPARDARSPLEELFPTAANSGVSLQSLRENLDKAASHDNIGGVLLEIDVMTAGWASLEEARRIIDRFREDSDKFIYTTTNDIGLNEKGYYLASATDSVFSPPETFFEFDGFYSEVMFLEGLFNKIGLEAEIARHGEYKGAVEPFMQQELSEENREQLNAIVGRAGATFVEAASAKSGLESAQVHSLLNGQPQMSARFGYENGFIDSLLYRDELENHMKGRLGVDAGDELQTVDFKRYTRVTSSSAGLTSPSTQDRIAVIYASGMIAPDPFTDSPFGEGQMISTSFFEEQLEEIRDDGDVKALVVRVNSPGGSGSTSDAIWRMLNQMRDEMPVIVSMGDMAASGGYYIAAAADTILAETNTLTGSIGVFSTKFNAQQLFNEKLGLTFGTVTSHEHADWLSPSRGFTPSEQQAFQKYVDRFYDTFITKMAASRGMEKQRIDELAGGRVWTGEAAQQNGLVDLLGGMDRALEVAAAKAGLEAYRVSSYPEPESLFEFFMGSAQTQVRSWVRSLVPGSTLTAEAAIEAERAMGIFGRRDPLTLFPYDITVE